MTLREKLEQKERDGGIVHGPFPKYWIGALLEGAKIALEFAKEELQRHMSTRWPIHKIDTILDEPEGKADAEKK